MADDLDGVTLPDLIAVVGTGEQFHSVGSIEGITSVDDHGNRRLDDGRVELLLNASSQAGIDQLKQAGFTVTVVMTGEQRKNFLRGAAARQFDGGTT